MRGADASWDCLCISVHHPPKWTLIIGVHFAGMRADYTPVQMATGGRLQRPKDAPAPDYAGEARADHRECRFSLIRRLWHFYSGSIAESVGSLAS
jgi:hypothetical protein